MPGGKVQFVTCELGEVVTSGDVTVIDGLVVCTRPDGGCWAEGRPWLLVLRGTPYRVYYLRRRGGIAVLLKKVCWMVELLDSVE